MELVISSGSSSLTWRPKKNKDTKNEREEHCVHLLVPIIFSDFVLLRDRYVCISYEGFERTKQFTSQSKASAINRTLSVAWRIDANHHLGRIR